MKKTTFLCFILFAMALQGQNKLLSSIDEFYDGANWHYSSGANYEYDSNNNLISETELDWNFINSKWENSAKIIYTYDMSINKVTNALYQNWNSTNNMFENFYQTNYTYDGGKITESVNQSLVNGIWENEDKTSFIYDGVLIDEVFDYNWNGAWVVEYRYTPTYNGNNRFETILIDDWDNDNSMWISADRQTFTYDGNNRLAMNTYETFEDPNWVEDAKTEYTVDANGNREKEVNTYGGDTEEENYVYDTNFLMSNFAHPFKEKTGLDYIVEDFPYYNKLLSTNDGDGGRTTYNYESAIILGVEDFKIVNNNIKVFPNPTSGKITIESLKSTIKNVEIYSVIGSKVFSTQENRFNIDNLSTGVYVLRMTSNDGAVYTRRIIRN